MNVSYPHSSKRKTTFSRGFTLVELMVSMTIVTLIGAGTYLFTVDVARMAFTSEQKVKINNDMRTLTNEMTDIARNADSFTLYESFSTSFRTPESGKDYIDYRLQDGRSGDCLAIIDYGDDPNPQDSDPAPIERIVCYFREVTDTDANKGPVMKMDITVTGADQYKNPEELIPSSATNATQVVELTEGLADGKLFYRFRKDAVMVNGVIEHGNAAKRITDTYNFTISTRGG